MEDAAARARRYEQALQMIWNLTRGKNGATARAERDIAAVALGLRVAGTHLRGIDHLAPPKKMTGS
jgi:hypothetical protein